MSSIKFTVDINSSSGISIRASTEEVWPVGHEHHGKTTEVMIAPWVQFSWSGMTEYKQKCAYEIVRRVQHYDEMVKHCDYQDRLTESHREACDHERKRFDALAKMWKEERAKYGLPEDFSDVKVWPDILMNK